MENRRAPPGALARLVEQIESKGRLAGRRRLRGGVGARMDVLVIARPDGPRRTVTLRRFPRSNRSSQPAHVAHEFAVLRLVERLGLPAPRPLWLDAEGELFGVPAMALTYLPGGPVYIPSRLQPWADELARALAEVHAVTPARHDLSLLGVQGRDGVRRQLRERRRRAREHSELAREVHAALVRDIDRVAWPAPTLVHDDFWPGNTVWHRGRLTAIVDWTHGEVGDPRTDIAQCRIDLALILDQHAANVFLAAYQARAPRPLPDVWYFDLLRGLAALLSYEFWLPGYHDAGLTHVTKRCARGRIEAFLRRALAERSDHPSTSSG